LHFFNHNKDLDGFPKAFLGKTKEKTLWKIRGLAEQLKVFPDDYSISLPSTKPARPLALFYGLARLPWIRAAWAASPPHVRIQAEQIYRPDSVRRVAPAGNHSSAPTIAGRL